MIKKTIILLGTVLLLFSCAPPDNSGSSSTGGTTSGGVTGGLGPPPNHSSGISSNNNCNIQGGEWGGVTCLGGSNRDEGFLGFLSIGIDTSNSNTKGVAGIDCQPSNNGGVVFRMKVALNAPFDPNGSNSNLAMQQGSSKLEVVVSDISVIKQNLSPLAATYNGLRGDVNGNQATLVFDRFHKTNGRQEVTFDGHFDAEYYTGNVTFSNEKDWRGRSGASGTLGKFKIPVCPIFQ